MAWSQEELNFFSSHLGMPITPETALGTVGNTPMPTQTQNPHGIPGGMEGVPKGYEQYYSDLFGSPSYVDPATGKPIHRVTDLYQAGTTDILDPSKLKYDPYLGIYTDLSNMKAYENTDWGLIAILAVMGGIGLAGAGVFGAAAQSAVYGAEAAGAISGGALTATGEAMVAKAGAGGVATGAGGETAAGMLAAQEAGFTAGELAGWGGATTTGAGAVTAGAGATQQAMLAEQYAGLGYNQATANTLAAADISSGTYGLGSTMATKGGMLDTLGGAYNTASNANKLNNTLAGGTTGSAGMTTDWGQLLGGLGSAALTENISGQGIDYANELANQIEFTPYSISSGMGQTYQDPATGKMISQLSPEYQQYNDVFGDAVLGNMQYASMDPMQASQYAYNMGSQLNSYQDEQNRLGLESRLLSQGMLGSTGGATQMRSLYDANNQRDLGREAQSLQLGQQMLTDYQNRATSAYQPMISTQQGMANQMGQSASMGGQALTGQQYGANLLNNAYQAQLLGRANAGQNLMGSGMFTGGTSGSATNSLINQGISAAGNWLGGNTNYSVPDASYSWQNTPTDSSSFWGNGDYSNVDWYGFGG